MKTLGAFIIALGIGAGLTIFLWLGLEGGIVQAVNAANQTPVNTGDMVWGILRASVLGPLVAFAVGGLFIIAGMSVIDVAREEDRRKRAARLRGRGVK